MIDITLYQERLSWLKEWLTIRIDAYMMISAIDEEAIMIVNMHKNDLSELSFERYCKLKQTNK